MKYIVLGAWRTGTTVLHESLSQHPDIKIAYEIFHPAFTVDSSGMDDIEDVMLQLYGSKKLKINKTCFSCKHPNKPDEYVLSSIRGDNIANGYDLNKLVDLVFYRCNAFKILYCQLPRNYPVWDYLASMKDIKIIHLIRDNYLEMIVSLMSSYNTGIWQRTSECEKIDDKPIYLDPIFLSEFFEFMNFETEHYLSLFEDHPQIVIRYEDIFDWDRTINKVQEFLEIPRCHIAPKYLKRTRLSLSKLVQNYRDLYSYFANTKWSEFFLRKML